MFLWEVGVFNGLRIPKSPSGNGPADGPLWATLAGCSVWDPSLWLSLCPGLCCFAIWVEHGVGFEFYSFRALMGYPALPLSRVKDVFSIMFPFAASVPAYHRECS